MDYQHKSQITAPGYQLIRNEALPTGVSAKTLLNDQPWTKPVDTNSTNVGLRFEYQLNDDWRASVGANKHRFQRDDYTAFPYGCSNEGDGFYPGFCSNGDYDVYDYQSVGERRSPFGAQAMLQGKFATGAVEPRADRRRVAVPTAATVSATTSTTTPAPATSTRTLIVPPAPGNPTHRPGVRAPQATTNARCSCRTSSTLSQQFKLHAGLRYVQVKRTEFGVDCPSDDQASRCRTSRWCTARRRTGPCTARWRTACEHGGVAPIETTNANRALAPSRSKQIEFGVKGVGERRRDRVGGAVPDHARGWSSRNADGNHLRARRRAAATAAWNWRAQGKATAQPAVQRCR